jgi:hypothetical protein
MLLIDSPWWERDKCETALLLPDKNWGKRRLVRELIEFGISTHGGKDKFHQTSLRNL